VGVYLDKDYLTVRNQSTNTNIHENKLTKRLLVIINDNLYTVSSYYQYLILSV